MIIINRYKYPRTPHLPFSLGATDDDKILKSTSHFNDKLVVITEKMDGENTTIYNDYYHARSIDSKHKEYHSYLLANILPVLQYQIPDDYRVCGEYLYAKHSIAYNDLESYFLAFSIWYKDKCLSWSETVEISQKWGLKTVPVLYEGIYDENKVKEIAANVVKAGGEGIVVRLADSFSIDEFGQSMAKFVRANHVQTNTHWTQSKIEQNKLHKK